MTTNEKGILIDEALTLINGLSHCDDNDFLDTILQAVNDGDTELLVDMLFEL